MHYRPTDPKARISVKPGKAQALNYLCDLAVGTAQDVISPVQADLTDSRDNLHLPRLLAGLQQRLWKNELRLHDPLADAGYTNGTNYALLEKQSVTTWIPVFGQYKSKIDGFAYDPPAEKYIYPVGKDLLFQKYGTIANGSWLKPYRTTYCDCQWCPLKVTCIPKAKCKQLTQTIFNAPYRRV